MIRKIFALIYFFFCLNKEKFIVDEHLFYSLCLNLLLLIYCKISKKKKKEKFMHERIMIYSKFFNILLFFLLSISVHFFFGNKRLIYSVIRLLFKKVPNLT